MRSHKMIISFFTALFLLAISGTFSLCVGGEELVKGKPALPGRTCQTKPLPDWMPQEKWVWKQVCKGEIADLNKFEGLDTKVDPGKFGHLSEIRILTPDFLETILLHEPFRGALTRYGVRIVGAWFTDQIDLSDAILVHPLWLEGSRFDEDVDFANLKTDYVISLKGSKFQGKLNMNSIEVKSHLFMSNSAEFNEVELTSAKIGGQLNMRGSKFKDELIMDSLQVDNYLLMRDNAEFNYVSLLNAKIGSALEMDGSRFRGELLMQRLEVANNLFMRSAKFAKVILNGAKIGGNLELSGSTFNSIDLCRTSIGRAFMLSSKKTTNMPDIGAAEWHGDSKLTLHNTKVGVLQDSQNSWPENLALKGFTYDRLGNFISEDGNGIEIRDVSWLKKWMWKQEEYSPQPYKHLAKLLRQDGRKEEARKILFASKLREHGEATNIWCWLWLIAPFIFIFCRNYIRYNLYWFWVFGLVLLIIFAFTEIRYWVWLNAVLIFIGYGYHIDWALYWALDLVIIGVFVLWVSRQYRNKDLNHKDLKYCGLAYSIDMLLPIIHLREYHYDEIELEGWVRVYFYIHKILGYALALFIITGLTGIVK